MVKGLKVQPLPTHDRYAPPHRRPRSSPSMEETGFEELESKPDFLYGLEGVWFLCVAMVGRRRAEKHLWRACKAKSP